MRSLILGLFIFTSFNAWGDSVSSAAATKMLRGIQSLNHSVNSCMPWSPSQRTVTLEGQQWSSAGFSNPKISVLDYEFLHSKKAPEPLKNQISLTAVVFRKSGWSAEDVKRRLQAAAKIFEQCDIQIAKVDLVEVDAPEKWINVKSMPARDAKGGDFFEMSKALPKVVKPAIFYFGNSADGETGYAATETYVKDDNPLQNTIGIGAKVHEPKYIQERGKDYVSEAHELGHLIGNWTAGEGFGHLVWDDNNIMRGTGVKFNKDQCEDFKYSSLLTNRAE